MIMTTPSRHRVDAIAATLKFFDAESAPADVDVDVVREERVQHVQARFQRVGLLRFGNSRNK